MFNHKNKPSYILLAFLLLLQTSLLAQSVEKTYSLMLKSGYGGTYTYTGSKLNGIKDNTHLGLDFICNNTLGLTLNYDQPFLFDYFDLKEFTFALKYLPFQWYNQPFIGFGYTFGSYKYGQYPPPYKYYLDNQSGSHNGFCINWGLNIQFPKNIYVIFEATNIFNGYTGIISTTTQTMHVNGTLGYRINFKKK